MESKKCKNPTRGGKPKYRATRDGSVLKAAQKR
jgi:hypothetical protein